MLRKEGRKEGRKAGRQKGKLISGNFCGKTRTRRLPLETFCTVSIHMCIFILHGDVHEIFTWRVFLCLSWKTFRRNGL